MGGESSSVVADIGLNLSAFSLMLPWQQQAVQQPDEEDGAADAGASPSFQRSRETVNLWKAQHKMKAMTGPMSTHGSPRAVSPSSRAPEWRNRVAVAVPGASASLTTNPPMTATAEAPLTEVSAEELGLFGGVAHLLSSFGEGKPETQERRNVAI